MGKGLSPLQRAILALAYENAGRQTPQTDVLYSEVLLEYFGWEPTDGGAWWALEFSKKDIGDARYRRGMASLSRAVRRLEERGLVYKTRSMRAGGWSGANLTERGKEEARRLAEQMPPSGDQDQQA